MPERTSYDPGTPSWVDLTTTDLEGALRFYGDVFGWEFEDMGEEAGHYHQARLRGKRVAGIGPTQPGAPPMTAWTMYLAGSDVDAHARAIGENGGTVAFGPMDVFDQGRMLVAQDPTGAMFGVWEPRAHTGAELMNENATFTWNELMTRDVDAATRFYGAVFGQQFEPLPETPDGSYQLVKVGDQMVGGFWRLPDDVPSDVPAHWTTYFHMDDLDAALDRLRDAGGTVTGDPVDSPYGRWAVVADPQGGAFRIIQSANPDA
jgi:predicted enzyme related to lactoylglutathione lyase